MAVHRTSHRRRFVAGLALALLAGAGLVLALIVSGRVREREERAARAAVVTLQALVELVERVSAGGGGAAGESAAGTGAAGAGGENAGAIGDIAAELAALEGEAAETAAGEPGEAVRRAVSRFAAAHPEVRSIRVVSFEGIRLEASTDPADTAARAAPRRLERDEKPLYDRGQELRAAVSENREVASAGGAPIQEEIQVAPLPDGGFELAAPLERGGEPGEVHGMVAMRTARPARAPAVASSPWPPLAAACLLPLLALLALAPLLGERRFVLALAAAALLAAALAALGALAVQSAGTERRATAEAIAAHLAAEAGLTGDLVAELAPPGGPPLDPARWDTDLYRRPRGLLTAGGAIDEARLGEQIAVRAGRLIRLVALVALLALALLAAVGFGGAARVRRDLVEHHVAYAYTVPAMLSMLLLVFFPFTYSIVLAFTNANIYNTDQPVTELWVGLANFTDILGDWRVFERTADGLSFDYENFYWTLGFTTVWTITNVTIGVSVGLLLALALNTRGLAFRAVYRVILILPWAMPTYINALIFRGMFHQQFGVVNHLRQLFGADPVAWFDHPLTSFAAVLTTNGWLSFSFMMVISLGALQSIPADLYEAARVDGASRWQQFLAITLPSLRPALIPAIIISVIWTFNQFTVIYLVSAGQPAGATEILVTQAYKLAFEQYRYGYAAAYATLIFLILLAYGTWQNRVTRATESIA